MADMMTLADVREQVRLRLEDTGTTTSWSDEEIDASLRQALAHHSHRFPAEQRMGIPVSPGDSSIELPDELQKVVRVIDPRDMVVPPQTIPLRGVAGSEQAWEVWGNRLEFSRMLPEGTVQLWYLGARSFPEEDSGPVPVPDEDVSLLVLGSVAWCLEQRAVADWKRGALPARYETVLRRAQDDYRAAWRSRERRVRVGRVVGTG
jgi:hypothetical protein